MEAFAIYLIKATACLTIFAVLFRLLLLRETFFRFTRIVLLAGMLICSLLPLIKISTEQPNIIQQFTIHLEEAVETMQAQIAVPTAEAAHELTEATVETPALINSANKFNINWWTIITTVYLTGVGLMLLRLIISLVRLRQLLRSNTVITDNGYRLVITPDEVMPFSFFRYIVLSEKDYRDNPDAIILHEQMHMRKLHNIDVILSEIVLTLHWFNPMVWMLSRDLREIHEYEADSAVLAEGIAPQQYQLLLVKKAVGDKRFAAVVNNFNQSKIKNRITMMLKTQSTPWARLKALFIVPLAALALLAFSGIDQVVPENPKDVLEKEAAEQRKIDYLSYMNHNNPNSVGYIYVDLSENIHVMHRVDESYATLNSFKMNDDVLLRKIFRTAYDQALTNKESTLSFVIGAEDEVKMEAISYIKENLRKAYAEWSSTTPNDNETEGVKSKMLLSIKFIQLNDVYISTADKISKNPLFYWEEVQRPSKRLRMNPNEFMTETNYGYNTVVILINSENRLMIKGEKSEAEYHTPENLTIKDEFIDHMAQQISKVMENNRTRPVHFLMQADPETSVEFIHHTLTYALPMAYDKAISNQADLLEESLIEMKQRYPLLLSYYTGKFDLPDEWREHGKYYYAWSESEGETKSSNAMIGRANMPIEGDVVYPLTNPDRPGVSMVTLGAGVTRNDLQNVLNHIHGQLTDRVLYLFRSGD